MKVIWLIEDLNLSPNDLSSVLSANFPMRIIRSISSFIKLSAMEKIGDLPELVIVNADCELKIEDAVKLLDAYRNRRTPTLFAISVETHLSWHEVISANFNYVVLDSRDSLKLVSDIGKLLERDVNGSGFVSERTNSRRYASAEITFGDLTFDRFNRRVRIGDCLSEDLSAKESKILEILLLAANQTISRSEISREVWSQVSVTERTLDTHVSRLRRKISDSKNCSILSIYGTGYALKIEE